MFDPISERDYYALAGIFHSTKTVEHANVSKWLMADLPPVTRDEKHAIGVHKVFQQRLKRTKEAITAAEVELSNLSDPTLDIGIVIDDLDANVTGKWVSSTSVPNWIGKGYIHDNSGDGVPRQVEFRPELPADGRYEVRVAYSASTNRSTKTPVTIRHAGGEATVRINQRKKPKNGGLYTGVGIYEFKKGNAGSVTISNSGTNGVTIVDAVQWLPLDTEESLRTENDALEKRENLNIKIAALHKELKEIAKSEPKLQKLQTMTVRDEAKPGDTHLSIRGDVHNPGEIVPRAMPAVFQTAYQPKFSNKQSGRLELAKWLTTADHPLTARVFVNRLWAKLMGEGVVATPDNFGTTGDLPTNQPLLDWLALRLIENGWSTKQTLREILLSRAYQSAREKPRRLDAEALRDAILLASGQLDPKMGGPAIKPGTRSEFGYKFVSNRRSLYLPVFRNALPDLFAVFDFPDPNLVAGKRNDSTLATQALYFMNHPFVIEHSELAAKALLEDEKLAAQDRISHAYRSALGRPPSQGERALAEKFLGASDDVETWSAFYQSLFACIDFRYVD